MPQLSSVFPVVNARMCQRRGNEVERQGKENKSAKPRKALSFQGKKKSCPGLDSNPRKPCKSCVGQYHTASLFLTSCCDSNTNKLMYLRIELWILQVIRCTYIVACRSSIAT